MGKSRATSVWVVTEGAAGMENQALGLAERLGLPFEIKRVKLATPWRWLAPRLPVSPFAHATPDSTPLAPPWPDLVIGCGRQSIPFVLAIKQASGGRTLLVQTQNPRVNPARFDLVIPPQHDGLSGPNVLPIIGSPNRITQAKLKGAREAFAKQLMPVKAPRLAVLIGGPNKVYKMGESEIDALSVSLRTLSRDHGLIVLPSRRTGDANVNRIAQTLTGTGAYIWRGGGENPYMGALAWAEAFLVTADSVNMACEAAGTGKPVHIFPLPGGSPKFRKFHDSLAAKGIAREFTGEIQHWNYEPLDETGRAAKRIAELLDV
ncbi:MAG TPA: mitochondrial fission ELM1 family protein [Rhizomicrobium sp.]|jgi:hypothetical protein